jgi:NAD(P)H-hydrate repair Nnr-like enzyme with NAD(P)H-hydrate dehydratase domain
MKVKKVVHDRLKILNDEVTELKKDEIKTWLSIPRRPNTHKGDYGHLLVIAGSVGKTGAAAMACEAALRGGYRSRISRPTM